MRISDWSSDVCSSDLKWDTVENGSALYQGIKQALSDGLAQIRGVPITTVSAATGQGLDDLIRVAFETRTAWSQRVSTGILNRWFERALEANPPPAPGGKREIGRASCRERM